MHDHNCHISCHNDDTLINQQQQQRRQQLNHIATSHEHRMRRSMPRRCSLWLSVSSGLVAVLLVMLYNSHTCHGASRNMHQISKQTNQYFLNEFCDLQSKTLRNAKKFRTNPETFSIFLTSKNSLSSVRVLPQKARQQQPQLPASSSQMSFSFAPPAPEVPEQTPAPVPPTPTTTTSNLTTISNGTITTTANGTTATNVTAVTAAATTTTPEPVPMPSPEVIQQYQTPVLKQLNCSIIVVAPRSHGLLVTVNSIGLPHRQAKLGITLNYDSQQAQSVSLDGDVTSGKYLLTQSARSKIAINLQSFAPIDWSRVSFDILFTVYKSKTNTTGCPNKSWFDCGDNICVPSSLVCDNNRNCPNGNDEMILYHCYTPLFWSIAASTALALLLAIIICVLIVVLRRRNRAAALARLHHESQFTNNLLHNFSSASKAGLNYCDASEQHYLADNMTGGFENPVWLHTTNTLTKNISGPAKNSTAAAASTAAGGPQIYVPQQVPVTITSTTSTLEPIAIIQTTTTDNN